MINEPTGRPPQTADELNRLALTLAQQGKLQEAIAGFEHALLINPDFSQGHYNLGKALQDQGRFEDAAASYQRALERKPDYTAALNNLGTVFMAQKRFDTAVACFRRTLELAPHDIQVRNNLAAALQAQGKLTEALICKLQGVYDDKGFIRMPQTTDELNHRAITLAQQGNLDEAIAHFERILLTDPNFIKGHFNLGFALQNQGRLEEAAASYRRALDLKPDYSEALNNLGTVLTAQKKLDEALACYRRTLELTPRDAGAQNNLGTVLLELGKLDEAATCYRQALAAMPDYTEAHNNLGVAMFKQGRLDDAVGYYRRALELKPNYPEAFNHLGTALMAQGKVDEAVACNRRALELRPDFAEVYDNLGAALCVQGKVDEAIACNRRALELRPDFAEAHSSLIFMMYYHPDYDPPTIFEECRRWNRRHAEPHKKGILRHLNDADPVRKLRIGYVSPDFCDHVLSSFTIPLLSSHDHGQFTVICYANVTHPDALTERLRGYTDGWRELVGLSDQQAADLVRSDQIDILVELTMHSTNNRLLVFARKPAPVQVAWLGINGTTGLSTIDYRLTDPYLDAPELSDAYYSEESFRLPETLWCYYPLADQVQVNRLPASQNGYVTFGCLNNFMKINDGVLALWATVLNAIPHSRLLLLAPRGEARDHVLATLQQQGIAKARLEFVDRRPRLEYFQLYNQIDLCLDTIPYNGHTTSLDAFWMGVPTITLLGKTVVGREGYSQLCNLRLEDLVARTNEEFVAIATKLTNDLPRLTELRATLRQRMLASPLMDAKRFTRNVEQAYRQMWRRWCREVS